MSDLEKLKRNVESMRRTVDGAYKIFDKLISHMIANDKDSFDPDCDEGEGPFVGTLDERERADYDDLYPRGEMDFFESERDWQEAKSIAYGRVLDEIAILERERDEAEQIGRELLDSIRGGTK